jgi:mannose/cellobiose epimerase-like protein (N-acyl-D-glucosamine 2-epimerase family)
MTEPEPTPEQVVDAARVVLAAASYVEGDIDQDLVGDALAVMQRHVALEKAAGRWPPQGEEDVSRVVEMGQDGQLVFRDRRRD